MNLAARLILDELLERYPILENTGAAIEKAFEILRQTYSKKGTVFCCGNGGSAADSEHMVAELLKCFRRKRLIDPTVREQLQEMGEEGALLIEKLEGALPAISLASQSAILTAFANDASWKCAFAQQLYGLGKKGDCLIAFSTSGNSVNCILASVLAKARGISTIAFTGNDGGKLAEHSTVAICVPEKETYLIQEIHLPIYHALCAMLEAEFFS